MSEAASSAHACVAQGTYPLHAYVRVGAQARLANYGEVRSLPAIRVWVMQQPVSHAGCTLGAVRRLDQTALTREACSGRARRVATVMAAQGQAAWR